MPDSAALVMRTGEPFSIDPGANVHHRRCAARRIHTEDPALA